MCSGHGRAPTAPVPPSRRHHRHPGRAAGPAPSASTRPRTTRAPRPPCRPAPSRPLHGRASSRPPAPTLTKPPATSRTSCPAAPPTTWDGLADALIRHAHRSAPCHDDVALVPAAHQRRAPGTAPVPVEDGPSVPGRTARPCQGRTARPCRGRTPADGRRPRRPGATGPLHRTGRLPIPGRGATGPVRFRRARHTSAPRGRPLSARPSRAPAARRAALLPPPRTAARPRTPRPGRAIARQLVTSL